MSGLNKCMFIGRLGKDPETKSLNSGESVSNFSVAVSEKWKDKSGETKEKTEWIKCNAWGKLSDIAAKYLHKGDQVYVEGKMSTRSWEADGVTKYSTEITVMNLVMLGSKSSGTNDSKPETKYQEKPEPVGNNDFSDLPF